MPGWVRGQTWPDAQAHTPLPVLDSSERVQGTGSVDLSLWLPALARLGPALPAGPGSSPAPGVCQPPEAGGTVPAARTAGSSFADVSKEARGF